MKKNKNLAITIVGSTASGKSDVAFALAKKICGEIYSIDSLQSYKKFEIGTAKPKASYLEEIKHYYVDSVDPHINLSVLDFKSMFLKNIEKNFKNNNTPIIVGGSGFYLNSLYQNLDYDLSDKELEEFNKLGKILENKNNFELLNILRTVFSKEVKQDDKNNKVRLIKTIQRLTYVKSQKKETNFFLEKFENYIFYLNPSREINYKNINKRVDQMVDSGLIKEAKEVYQDKNISNNLKSAIGYKEFVEFFLNNNDLEKTIEEVKKNTRRYSKRQKTFFKNKFKNNIIFIDTDNLSTNQIVEKIFEKLNY